MPFPSPKECPDIFSFGVELSACCVQFISPGKFHSKPIKPLKLEFADLYPMEFYSSRESLEFNIPLYGYKME